MKLTLNQTGVAPTKLVGAAWALSIAITLVTLGGFGMVLTVVLTLIEKGINLSEGGMVLVLISLLIILTIDVLLVRQLSRVLSIPHVPVPAPAQRPTLSETPKPQIGAAHAPMSSVTDHTTRTLEPVYKDRDKQRS